MTITKTLKIAGLAFGLVVWPGHASLILDTPADQPTDLKAFGFGAINPLLTLQQTGSETGCVTPDNSGAGLTLGCVGTAFDVTFADSMPTSAYVDPAQTPKYEETTLGARGIDSYADFAILFNANEPGSTNQITIQALSLGFYDSNNALVGDLISLDHPVTLSNIASGQGAAGYLFRISPTEYPCGGTGVVSAPCDSYHLGLAATIIGTSGGAESFTIANVSGGGVGPGGGEIPEPTTLIELGSGLMGLFALSWGVHRRHNWCQDLGIPTVLSRR